MNPIDRRKHFPAGLSVLVATVLLVAPHSAVSQLNDICLPTIGDVLGNGPTMNGKPQDDVGWNNAGQLALGQTKVAGGTPVSTMVKNGNLQYGVKDNYLYLSIDLDNSAYPPNPNTTVILVLSPDGNAANDWRLHLSPFGGLSSVPALKVWRGSGGWNTPTSVTPCPGTAVGHTSNCGKDVTLNMDGTVPAQSCALQPEGAQFTISTTTATRWGLEARIPYSTNPADASSSCKLYLPDVPGTFKAYFNVVSTNSLNFGYTEDPWPTTSELVFAGLPGESQYIERSTPDVTKWGVASLGSRTDCKGVSIVNAGVRQTLTGALTNTSKGVAPEASGFYEDLGTHLTTVNQCQMLLNKYRWDGTQSTPTVDNPRTPTSFVASVDNYFIATAKNDSGSSIPAGTLSAKFYLAPWGLPGNSNTDTDWDLIGKRYDPDSPGGNDIFQTTANSTSISDGASVELQTDWRLSYKESCAYSISGLTYGGTFYKGHHCVQAELVSTDRNTNFTTKSLQFNHNVVPASRAEQRAVISTKGYGPPPAGHTQHEIVLSVDQLVLDYSRDGDYYYPRSRSVAKGQKAVDGRNSGGSPSPAFSSFSSLGVLPAELVPNGVTEALALVARGYLATSDTVVINGTTYKRGQYIGAFSLEAVHNGVVEKWSVAMSPEQCPGGTPPKGCVTGSGNRYVLHIPENETMQLAATVEAVPQCNCKCFDVKCKMECDKNKQAALESGRLAGALGLFGTLGVGGLAFLRRRRTAADKGSGSRTSNR